MKTTIVPAQVTTVEDRVAGSLSFSQLVLLAVPVFGGAILCAVVPPFMGASLMKGILAGVIAMLCGILAVRVKGTIVFLWLLVLLRYASRPRIHVFDKGTCAYRQDFPEAAEMHRAAEPEMVAAGPVRRLAEHEKTYLLSLLHDPMERLSVELTRKGGIDVSIPEAKD